MVKTTKEHKDRTIDDDFTVQQEKNKQTKIIIDETDIAIVVTRSGHAEAYVPMEKDISWESIHKMLKEIRKIELVITQLVNKTYNKTENTPFKHKE